MSREFKLVCIKDKVDNPLRIEFIASGFEVDQRIGVFIDDKLFFSIFVDKDGNIYEKDIQIPERLLVDFTSLGGFGMKLTEEKSEFRKTGVIGQMTAGNIKLDVRYF